MVYPIIDSDIFQTNKMSFTLYLWIQIPLTIALVCLVIYQHRLYYKQKKLIKEIYYKQKKLIKEMIERDIYGLDDEMSNMVGHRNPPPPPPEKSKDLWDFEWERKRWKEQTRWW